MDRQNLLRRVGSMQQLAYVRPITFNDGRASGLKAYEVKNGPLQYKVLAGKCLDIGEFSYKGINFNFLSKPGLQGRNHYDTYGQEALRSIMGGLFFTAGLENICAPCTVDGVDYPMHGRIRTTPAENLQAGAGWEGDRYVLRTAGEMREGELFGENLVLHRSIETVYGTRTVTLTDEVENQGFRDEPLMLLYHINLGYPFLDEDVELLAPTRSVTPRDRETAGHEDRWNRMDAPRDNEPEYVFIHDLAGTPDRQGVVCAINDRLGLGLRIAFTRKNLPYFMEWKSTASGDYVLGLEPSNSSVYGRPFHEKEGTLHRIAPFDTEKNVLTFTILEGGAELKAAREEISAILNS
ncbi:MAG: aldose 1-epimerase family protein [Oscillospiraceae bacterium]|nr:aldose 1-epimerase family protein [Oscillospiraceae bacterium]